MVAARCIGVGGGVSGEVLGEGMPVDLVWELREGGLRGEEIEGKRDWRGV